MEYRRVGNSGLKVSVLSFGGWLTLGNTVGVDTASQLFKLAIDSGVNSIDLADVYAGGEAEKVAGEVLQAYRRTDLVIATKVFWPMSDAITDRGLSRKHIMESVDRSLRNLRTDYLDLYYCHREDPETPLEETVSAMSDLVRRGKILYWGTSMWKPKSLIEAHAIANRLGAYAPIVEQPQYSLVHRWIEKKVMPTAQHLGMGLMTWSPLAGGLLTGKYQKEIPAGSRAATTKWLEEDLNEFNHKRVHKLCEIAQEVGGVTPAQVSIAWLLKRPELSSVILGATSADQLQETLRSVNISISREIWARVERVFPA